VDFSSSVYFINEVGKFPSAKLLHDAENGVTILVVVKTRAPFADAVKYAVITDVELQNAGLSLGDAAESLLSPSKDPDADWCWVKHGSFNGTGQNPVTWVLHHTCLSRMLTSGCMHQCLPVPSADAASFVMQISFQVQSPAHCLRWTQLKAREVSYTGFCQACDPAKSCTCF
jgi:hypothetical protein